ncbi:sterol desaturase family protein [Flavobacteriales bacterium]|jgi:beta-carotene 3-hydroxylase|nr:sterol desaturase family protein [Flavobacteriales bacterium]
MSFLVGLVVVFVIFWTMELVAWATHKYVMHGFLWSLHKDHHQVDKNKVLEKNDSFFLIFAIPGSTLIVFGEPLSFYIGIGITLYGLAYFIIHEIFIHQRIKLFRNTKSRYLKAIRRAHKIHHKNLNKEDGSCFGMLIVPMKYLKLS